MPRPLTRTERRACALLILGALAASAYWLLIASWFSGPLASINEQISQLREVQHDNAQLLVRRGSLERRLDAVRTDPSSADSLLPPGDPSAVAADLMQQVSDQVTDVANLGAGCSVQQRMPMLSDASAEPYLPVKVSLTLECAIQPLVSLLHALETQRPMLFVEHLSVQRRPDAALHGPAGRLTVHLLVRGYLPPAPPEKSAGT
jgi:general secretion pathway protein M